MKKWTVDASTPRVSFDESSGRKPEREFLCGGFLSVFMRSSVPKLVLPAVQPNQPDGKPARPRQAATLIQ